MTESLLLYGTDLRLFTELDRVVSNRDPGHDVATNKRSETGQIDLDKIEGVDNLKQALFLRLLTPQGALSHLGHPLYGSRLATLIGENNTETNRHRAKLYILEALNSEPRIKKILSVQVTQTSRDPACMDIKVSLIVIDESTPINLVFTFSLQ
jgi:phage baseplate assembly protein W